MLVTRYSVYWILKRNGKNRASNESSRRALFVLIDCYFERFRNQQLVVAD